MTAGCETCGGLRVVDYDTRRPAWPATEVTPETPSQLLLGVKCPDCVPCVQCANPNHDGLCTCRKNGIGEGWRILPPVRRVDGILRSVEWDCEDSPSGMCEYAESDRWCSRCLHCRHPHK